MTTATLFGMVGGSAGEAASDSGLKRLSASRLPVAARISFLDGLDCLNRGEAREAASRFEQVLAVVPEIADCRVGLGIAYALDGRIYPALDQLETATQLEPENFYAHFKLGQLYFKLRVSQKGYAEMSRALDCASSPEERKLVACLLREERQREKNGVVRPWWNKPFSVAALYLGVGLAVALLVALVVHMR